jgi:alpha-tubulin suppressor-like RCC1 family protein
VGGNSLHQLGLPNPQTLQSIPVKLDIPFPVTQIACGAFFSMAIVEGGDLYSWGLGDQYQLANTSEADARVDEKDGENEEIPKKVQLGGRIVHDVKCGMQHTILLLAPI